jgi:20S proteasome alpha/beta subunit
MMQPRAVDHISATPKMYVQPNHSQPAGGLFVTVHIGFANPRAALLASDSQGSDDISEFHGYQKQFVGPDFVVGIAGLGLVLDELFSRMQDAIAPGPNQLVSSGIRAFIEQFVAREIQASVRSQIEIIVITCPDVTGNAVHVFRPGVFTRMGRPEPGGCIGSGSEFVQRAIARYLRIGINISFQEIADLVVAAEDLAKAADESLTVDDSFMVGIVTNNRSYLMGDRRIKLLYAPEPLRQQWAEAANRFQQIMAAARAINGELVSAQRGLSAIRTGTLTQTIWTRSGTATSR